MSTKLRRRRNFKKRFFLYVLFLAVVVCGAFFLNTFSVSKGPLFISPLGKVNVDLNKVRKALIDKNISFSTVSLSDYSYLIILQNNEQIRISESKDIVKQITSLQRILNQLTIEGKSFKSIDFRFTEPIISF
jgi:hypothetical protein